MCVTPLIAALALVSLAGSAQAAQFQAVDGRVEIERKGVKFPAVKGVRLKEGDVVRTTDKGEAVVSFVDGSAVAVRTGTQFTLDRYQTHGKPEERSKVLNLTIGALRYVSAVFGAGPKMDTSLQTATATIGIRGTDFELSYLVPTRGSSDPAGTYVRVNSGLVAVTGKDGSEVEIGTAQTAFAGEPQLAPMGGGAVPPPASRRVANDAVNNVFRNGRFDDLLAPKR